jgi:hypothetical protein
MKGKGAFQQIGNWKEAINAPMEAIRKIEKGIAFKCHIIGAESVDHARTHKGYKDQTGNLKNSIGYVIGYNGKVIDRVFKNDGSITENKQAYLADEKVKELLEGDKGYTLIIVAGMNYGAAVEGLYSKNVLTGTKFYFEGEFDKRIQDVLKEAGFK